MRISRRAGKSQAPGADPRADITGVVLAGGLARRMGGRDKGLVEVGGRPMVAHILAALRPQVGRLLVNANRNPERYRELSGCPVVADSVGDFAGPLAGMAAGLQASETPYVLTVPCDSPLIAPALAERLHERLTAAQAEVAAAADGERLQPVFALLRRDLLPDVVEYLASGERKIDRWYARHRLVEVDFSDHRDMFLNINTPEERDHMESRLEARRSGQR